MATGAQAAQPYVADQVIVKYQSGITESQRSALLERSGVERTLGSVKGVNARVLSTSADVTTVTRRLNASSLVVYAEPNYILRTSATPNDPRFGELYGLNNTGQGGGTADADIDAPEGWDLGGLATFPGSGGAKVGIVDTGIDQAHEDLQGKTANCARSGGGLLPIGGGSIQEGSCADDNDHGTHVAGTIAATANNGKGVAGVSFNSQLAICKALGGPLGSGATSDVANCINWTASKGVKVISMSLGGGSSTTLQQAVRNADDTAIVIAAAGNDGDGTLNYPAAYPEVVSVAATDNRDQRASFSNANADVEIAAPGVDILSTRRGGGYSTLVRHVHGHAARGRRGSGDRPAQPGLHPRADPQQAGCRGGRQGRGGARPELRLRAREPGEGGAVTNSHSGRASASERAASGPPAVVLATLG